MTLKNGSDTVVIIFQNFTKKSLKFSFPIISCDYVMLIVDQQVMIHHFVLQTLTELEMHI